MKVLLEIRIVLCLFFLLGMSVSVHSQTGMKFDGIDDYVSVPNASALIAGSSTISLSLWVYPKNTSAGFPDFDGFAGFRNNVDADFYIMQLYGDNVEARFRNSSETVFDILVFDCLNLNDWNHFVLTYDGSTLILYQNGVSIGSTSANGTISNTSQSLDLGCAFFTTQSNSFYLDGKLDNITLWNSSMTPAEVLGVFTNNCTYDFSNPSLLLCYQFTEGVIGADNTAISNMVDLKGNIDGVFYNMTLSGPTSNYALGLTQPINEN